MNNKITIEMRETGIIDVKFEGDVDKLGVMMQVGSIEFIRQHKITKDKLEQYQYNGLDYMRKDMKLHKEKYQ